MLHAWPGLLCKSNSSIAPIDAGFPRQPYWTRMLRGTCVATPSARASRPRSYAHSFSLWWPTHKLRVQPCHHRAVEIPGAAFTKVGWWVLGWTFGQLVCQRLEGGGGHVEQQFAQVGTAADAPRLRSMACRQPRLMVQPTMDCMLASACGHSRWGVASIDTAMAWMTKWSLMVTRIAMPCKGAPGARVSSPGIGSALALVSSNSPSMSHRWSSRW